MTKTKLIFSAAILFAVLMVTSCNSEPKGTVDELISTYMTADDLPTFTERGTTDSLLSLIETSFNSKEYELVNNIVIANQDSFSQEDLDAIYLYQGVAYAQRGMYDKAYDVLANKEIYDNSLYGQMANWYLAMAMLKNQKVSEAKKLFTQFANDEKHYKQEESKEILKKFKI